MFRREWHRQALILALLTVAVATTIVGLAVVSNAVELRADPTFGTANTIVTVNGSDQAATADIAAARQRFATIDVVSHRPIAVPGSVSSVDLRAENPNGPYVKVTLRLNAGRYPAGPDQVAVTDSVARAFDLRLGSVWHEGDRALQVVGLVENPLNLLDQFALLAPGQDDSPANVSILINATRTNMESFRFPGGADVATRGTASKTAAEAAVLVLATLGLLFVGLLAVAGFAVIAQRRLRSLGMLSSLGATDRHVRLVLLANGAVVGVTSAAVGAAVGLAGWVAFAPTLQSLVEHRVNRFDLPWWAIGSALVLAVATAVTAAWWPARAVTRIPIMAALTGRPPRPQPAHRFATAGGLLLGGGLSLLAFAHRHKAPFIIGGTVATVVGLLLIAPLAIQAVAKLARRAPISTRLALRDLARHQSRSGAALGAATLAVAIAATIAITSAAAQSPPSAPNLPTNQLVVYIGAGGANPGNPVPVLTPDQQAQAQRSIDQLATTLNAQSVLPVEGAINPDADFQPPQPGLGGQAGGPVIASLARITVRARGEEVNAVVQLYVATPALLAHYGIDPAQIDPTADIISFRTDLGGLQIFLPEFGKPVKGGGTGPPSRGASQPPAAAHPKIQLFTQLPADTSDPGTLLTSHGLQALGLQPIPAGWVIQTPHPLTAAQIDAAQKSAASVGLSVETTFVQKSLASLRNWSTAAGILVALGVLAMTVGLIRSETANDLRTLTATGASSTTRRSITGATAGTLALLGAVLGTGGAYAGLVAWYRSDLHPLTHVPFANLVIMVVALPLIATGAGWLLAGREPPAIARQPLE